MAIYDAAKAALVYQEEISRLSVHRDHLRSLISNHLAEDEKRTTIDIADVRIHRNRRFVYVCECHSFIAPECPSLEAGSAVTVYRIEQRPSIWVTRNAGKRPK